MHALALLAISFLPQQDLASAAPQQSSEPEPRAAAVTAVRLDQSSLAIDGLLDEAAWQSAPVVTSFQQRDPVEGAAPTEHTAVRVIYDDDALYIGAQMYDSAPDSIIARLGRRDAQLESDYFTFYIDPYMDRRSGFYFSITAGGTLSDGVLMNDDWNDNTWDGVWQGKARRNEQGWAAELRIPYSQLRYRKDAYLWGVNFRRFIARKNEFDYLVYTPRDESGFVSRFIDLTGIRNILPARQVEVMPYMTAKAEYTHPDAGNPFSDGSHYRPSMGADVKVGLSSNLTLNATINPDFGQVEVDPAVVNLSTFETFFDEKRPFFIEGASIFNFGYGGSRDNWGFNWGNPDIFYSRRIGRTPQGELPDNDFSDIPDATRILGAAKISGRVADNWNVGAIQAVTAREKGGFSINGVRSRQEIEPPGYYGVLRAQKEIDEGRHGIGFISTATVRRFRNDVLRDEISGRAYVAGADGWTFLDRNKTWVVSGWSGISNVAGNRARIADLQNSSLHYFQRPDAGHIRVDSSATSLTGFAGRMALNKQQGRIILNTAVGIISPSFNVTDAGFQWRNDVINSHFGMGYRWSEPGRFTRNATVISALFRSLNFGGTTTWTGVWGLVETEFLNYYRFRLNAAYNPKTYNDRLTRGGPLTLNLPGYEINTGVNSDRRKAWVFGLDGGTYQSDWSRSVYIGTSVEWKPASNVAISVSPQVRLNDEAAQWVDVYDDPFATSTFGKRYVFADMDQVTVSSNIRLNWTFTPQLSFQLFAQPLISAGEFRNYKELARPKSFDFNVYGEGASTFDQESFVADPDGPAGPAAPIELENKDFNLRSLRGNAVLRWEYRPGSVVYLVWTQIRSEEDEEHGDFQFNQSVRRLWDTRPDNIFMLKLTYWIGR